MAAIAALAPWTHGFARTFCSPDVLENSRPGLRRERGIAGIWATRVGSFRESGGISSPGASLARRRMSASARGSATVPPVGLGARRREVTEAIEQSLQNCLTETHLHETVDGLGPKIRGKVRDIYEAGDYIVLVTTDRQSAFDRVVASVPFKGQVLNETSSWWFGQAQHITANAMVAMPDSNVTIARKCSVFPVEFVGMQPFSMFGSGFHLAFANQRPRLMGEDVSCIFEERPLPSMLTERFCRAVRGYVTGSTSTSLWTVYSSGVRDYCGNLLPDGFVKNQRLDGNILTPTTKAADHDVPISGQEIVERELMSKEDYEEVSRRALALFAFGQKAVIQHGLLLVDTKYEFGKTADGLIVLVDEVHTPDSSRYWIAASYEDRMKAGLEPESIDKEFLRLWFVENSNPYVDKVIPDAPAELVAELSWRYILLFETITGRRIKLGCSTEVPVHDRISRNVQQALQTLQL